MHLAGPREVCVCITYSREAWIEGPTGGVGEIAREMRVVKRERETNMTSRREIPLSVYMQGGVDRGTIRIIFLCGVCVGMCGCEKITRRGGRWCVTT